MVNFVCKVSILIPIYNVEKYLHQCLDSVVNQTLKDIEIICINDGSTDHSLDIINEFASKDSRIKVIDKKNTGYGHSMNQGLKLAQGEYIGIVESDDFAELNMFETLYNKAKSFNAEIIKSNWFKKVGEITRIIKMSNVIYEKFFSPFENYNVFLHQIAIWSAIYKRDFLLKNNIYFNETPGASYQDVSFFFKTMVCVQKIMYIEEAFLHYRMDNPNSSVKSKSKVYCIFDEIREIEKFLDTRDDIHKTYRYILETFKFKNYLFNYKRIDDKFKCEFLNRMSIEFKRDSFADLLDKTYWKDDSWQELQLLLSNENEFFYRQYEKIQKNRAYLSGFLTKIKSFRSIYLYGAGKVSAAVLSELLKNKMSVKGIIVSDKNSNPYKFYDIPVNIIEDANPDKEQDVILLAIKEEQQYEIFYQLQSKGYYNMIFMTKELRTALNY